MRISPVQFLSNSTRIKMSQNFLRFNNIAFCSDKLTIDYYDKIGSRQREDVAFEQTINQRNGFLRAVLKFSDESEPENINILDAGCGTGRDTKFFIEKGYNVDAFDASSEMAARASSYTGVDVACEEFLTFSPNKKYDGIYARNSLLHVPKDEFKQSVENMAKALKSDGILWATMKSGKGEIRDKKGRLFSYYSVGELRKILSDIDGVSIVKIKQYANGAIPDDNPIIEFIIKKD